ncbi:hypothetical protein [Streptosporangium lutulentum]|uniref:Uncharacterized protein n=1 Tax=Streptosporangium lutulentum TaxID=1461250 RepID=A0ABT9QB96_9ACTN|nr:hypothetical protein [Streptosporangium lutulentum]MDP9844047.1 hypothetical protein [Streptosporangium lutulentum]
MSVMAPPALAEPPEKPERVWTCFAIGPIGDAFAPPDSPEQKTYEDALEVFEHVTLAACRKFGINPVRADDLPGSGEINEQVCRNILEADIVIADLGGGNANVMYELGLRHATGKPTIQLGEHSQLPFDISTIRTIRFVQVKGGLIKARKALEGALEAGMRDGFDLLTPARVMRGQEIEPMAVDPVLAEDAPGFLDSIVLLETEMEAMTGDLEEIASSIETIGALSEASGPDLSRLTHEGAPMSARLAVVAKYAMAISSPADELEASAKRFAKRMQAIDGGVRGILNFVAVTPRDDRAEELDEFLNGLIGLAASARGGVQELNEFGTIVDGASGLSRHLRKPLVKISSAVGKVSFAAARIDEWAEAAHSLL